MFHTPAHKQLDPSKQGAQRVERVGNRNVMGYDVIQRGSDRAASFRDGPARDADNVKAAELRDALTCHCSSCDTRPLPLMKSAFAKSQERYRAAQDELKAAEDAMANAFHALRA